MKASAATIRSLRKDYTAFELDESHVRKNPLVMFDEWMKNALDAGVEEPNAMTIATVDSKGRPEARIVLLRELDKKGFVFYTNYQSRKGKAIKSNKHVCLNFFWPALQRQVRIMGRVEKVSERVSNAYFKSRPRESQIGAWASLQSELLTERRVLEERFVAFEKKFSGKPVPRPFNWGGYRVVPDHVEFWQGRSSRLHDRIAYSKEKNKWKISRLYP